MKFKATTLGCLLTFTCVLWAYWTGFEAMADRWIREEEYTHGWLVPLFAALILHLRLGRLSDNPDRVKTVEQSWIPRAAGGVLALGAIIWASVGQSGPPWLVIAACVTALSILFAEWSTLLDGKPTWLCIPFLLCAAAMRLLGAYFTMDWIDFLSLLPLLAGVALATGGSRMLAWSWPAIAYLIFMIPLPFRAEVAMRQPLRQLATGSSTYLLQTLGLPAFAEGNVVVVNDVRLDIVEACSGLRMLMVFFALSTAIVILFDRPLWQKVAIVISAVPIALVSNICRIVGTGLLYVGGHDALAQDLFHDLAGWLMMPLGLTLLFVELWYLDHLFILEPQAAMEFGLKDRPAAGLPRPPLSAQR